MGEIVEIAGGRTPPERWGALIALKPVFLSSEAQAQLLDFWGEDEHEPVTRLRAWAEALERLASEMRETALRLDGEAE